MSPAELPDDVRRFLLVAVPSVPHLEALLLMRDEGGAWRAGALAKRIYVAPERAAELLRDLAERTLLASRGDEYLYGPLDPGTRTTIDRLAALYNRHVVDIARLLHAKAEMPAQQFADAFRLRKES